MDNKVLQLLYFKWGYSGVGEHNLVLGLFYFRSKNNILVIEE